MKLSSCLKLPGIPHHELTRHWPNIGGFLWNGLVICDSHASVKMNCFTLKKYEDEFWWEGITTEKWGRIRSASIVLQNEHFKGENPSGHSPAK